MAPLLHIGQILKGRTSTYTVVKQLHRAAEEAAVYVARNHQNDQCIIKSIRGHRHLRNEADILKQYQPQASFLRPLIDEIEEPTDPPSIVLRYLDGNLAAESKTKMLTRPQIKQVARCILEGLRVLHKDGLVHTDVKLNNVLVNYGKDGQRFSEIQLSDFGSTVSQDSDFAKTGRLIGAAYTRSPEAMLQLAWGTPTDVWSFGNVILNLVHGAGYYHLDARWEGLEPGHPDYEYTILKRMYNLVGPFPLSMADITSPEVFDAILFFNEQGPPQNPLPGWMAKSIPAADKEFIGRILKLDPRDRPTVEEILQDEWFAEESEDTRNPGPECWDRKEKEE